MFSSVVLKHLNHRDEQNINCLSIIIKIAPLLKGYKQSSMLFVKYDELSMLTLEIEKSNLDLVTLYSGNNKYLILIYRKQVLDDYLSNSEIREFLLSYGYLGKRFDDYLPFLRQRLTDFYKLGKVFPHEVGIFLGYPLCDIYGFILYGGKDCLHSGYWKVYDNLEKAIDTFAKYDLAKKSAIEEWLAGRHIYEISC